MRRIAVPVVVLLLALAGPVAVTAADPIETPLERRPTALEGSSVRWCGDVTNVAAPDDAYRDGPFYVANEQPIGKLQRWAKKQPGFSSLWIDRGHMGWVTLAFTQDALLRQTDLEREFPGVGAVAVEVAYTEKELRKLQRRLEQLDLGDQWGSSIDIQANTVELWLLPVTEELVAEVERRYPDEPLCLGGSDPNDLPQPGAQPERGDGWRMLGWEQGTGPSYETGIATETASYERLWQAAGLDGEPVPIDFDAEIALWFAVGHGSSCSNLRLDEVIVDRDKRLVYPHIVMPGNPMMCTDDLAGSYQWVVALERDELPGGTFTLVIEPDSRLGVRQVYSDLSEPGATMAPGEGQRTNVRTDVDSSGTVMESIGRSRYAFDVDCGVGYLGVINNTHWVSDESDVPPSWLPEVEPDGRVVAIVRLRTNPEPTVRATVNDRTVLYRPAMEAPAACDA